MANLAALRQICRARYGGSRWNDEDALWNQVVLNDCVNEAHRDLAQRLLVYRQTQTYNITASDGIVELDCNVIEILPNTVEISLSSHWRRLTHVPEERLLYGYGSFREITDTDPWAYWLQAGDTFEQHRLLRLFPEPQTTVSSGLKLDAFIYPADMTADTHTPALQPAEHRHLIPLVCLRMAELDLSRGRQDAPVAYWRQQAEEALTTLKRTLTRFRRPGPRMIRPTRYHDYY